MVQLVPAARQELIERFPVAAHRSHDALGPDALSHLTIDASQWPEPFSLFLPSQSGLEVYSCSSQTEPTARHCPARTTTSDATALRSALAVGRWPTLSIISCFAKQRPASAGFAALACRSGPTWVLHCRQQVKKHRRAMRTDDAARTGIPSTASTVRHFCPFALAFGGRP